MKHGFNSEATLPSATNCCEVKRCSGPSTTTTAAIGIDLMITYVGIVIMMIVIGSTAVGMVEKMGQQTQHTAWMQTKKPVPR